MLMLLITVEGCSSSDTSSPEPVADVARTYAMAMTVDDEDTIRRLSCKDSKIISEELALARGGRTTGLYHFSYLIGQVQEDGDQATVQIIQRMKAPSRAPTDMSATYTFKLIKNNWRICARE